MSFERFSTSDIYMFESVEGFIECCGCLLADWDTDYFPQFKTPREAIDHLNRHEEVGHDTGSAIKRIMKDYPNLDVEIEPYNPPLTYEG